MYLLHQNSYKVNYIKFAFLMIPNDVLTHVSVSLGRPPSDKAFPCSSRQLVNL